MVVGMWLSSRLGVDTSPVQYSVYMFMLGVGIGGVMQVLVLAVQNDVDDKDLGVATSGATFFRSIGGSFGTAVFGAIFANALTGNLARYLAGIPVPAGFNAQAGASPAVLAKLPPAVHSGVIHAYAASLQTVKRLRTPAGAAPSAAARQPHHGHGPAGGKAVDSGASARVSGVRSPRGGSPRRGR